MRKPTCYDCVHASVFRGSSGSLAGPPEPPSADCQLPDGEQLQELHGDDAAPHCRLFRPIMADRCAGCGQPIGRPAYQWVLWVGAPGDNMPVCGSTCKMNVANAVAAEIAAELRGY